MNPTPHIVLPGARSGWELWDLAHRRPAPVASAEKPAEFGRAADGSWIGLPAGQCLTSAFPVPTTDATLFGDLAFAHLERRGLATTGGHAYHVIAQKEGETWLAVDALAAAFPESLCVPEAAAYTPASRFFPVPEDTLVLMPEHGHLLLAAGRNGKMAFSQWLTSGSELDASAAREVSLALLSLQSSGLVGEEARVEVWSIPRQEAEPFAAGLTCACSFVDRPAPATTAAQGASGPMLPPLVRAARERKARLRKLRTLLISLGALYLLVAAVLTVFLRWQSAEAARLEREVASNRPTAAFVQEALSRAATLEVAYDKRFYPMRQLNEVARLMPPSGVVIHKFSTQERSVRIEGLARDPRMAFQLKEDIEQSEAFPGYSWEMNPPTMNQNNSAAFRLEGKYAGAQ